MISGSQLRESLRKWQSPPDPSTSHNFASDRRHEGTAEWFIDDNKFEEWKVTGSLLWIHGKRELLLLVMALVITFRSGVWEKCSMVRFLLVSAVFEGLRSLTSSAIINDITALCKDASASMAYFYFDFRDINKKARRNLLPSLLTQLSDCSDHFCDILLGLYNAHGKGPRQPSDSASIKCLKMMLTHPNQGPVYLIMDALDECPITSGFPSARKQVLDLMKDLVNLRLPSLHIVVTSRPEVDITDVLRPIVSQIISLHDERGQQKDIANYVRSVVNSDSGAEMKRWRKDDKELVVETLSARVDGM
jgi:hypothetical protein